MSHQHATPASHQKKRRNVSGLSTRLSSTPNSQPQFSQFKVTVPATHLGTLSRLPTQTCWGGTVFHFLASTTIASASTSPKPYRWLTGKREGSETHRSACQTLLLEDPPTGRGRRCSNTWSSSTCPAYTPKMPRCRENTRSSPRWDAACQKGQRLLTFMPCSVGLPVGRPQVHRPRGPDQQVLDVPPGEQGAARRQGHGTAGGTPIGLKKGLFAAHVEHALVISTLTPCLGDGQGLGCLSRGGAPQGCCVHGCCRDFFLAKGI